MNTKKYEWRKEEQGLYLPKTKPEIIDIPKFKFFAVEGEGDPNKEPFGEYVSVLYSLSYAVRMSYKQGIEPAGYYQYTVYPLEGVWDVNDEVKKNPGKEWSKDDLKFNVMIRQPDFVSDEFFKMILENTMNKKPNKRLKEVKFIDMAEGKCCQMMHVGSYDSEIESFKKMEDYCAEIGYKRSLKTHREIYISDPSKTEPDKLKTVLRFRVE